MFSRARLCDSCSYTRREGARVCFSSPFLPPPSCLARPSPLAFPPAHENPRTSRDIKPTSMAILRRFFLRRQVPLPPPLLASAYCARGFTARFRTLFASRCLCGRRAIRADISAECLREVHIKDICGNLCAPLAHFIPELRRCNNMSRI